MKMPNEIPDHLLAPCGIACILCHRYCESDEPCQGCREGKGKSNHCKSCSIMKCANEKGHYFCFECKEFPCKEVVEFNDSYIERFGHEFLPNAVLMKKEGKEALEKELINKWTCPECGSIICIHDNKCSGCQKHYTGINGSLPIQRIEL